jgi:hypothetical protein
MNWCHKELWKFTDHKTFTVEVSRHEEPDSDAECYDSRGIHRWCVYAYLYPTHPLFAKFDDTNHIWQDATHGIPFHGGCTYNRKSYTQKDGEIIVTCVQVGCDYDHDGDWSFTQRGTKEDAYEVFNDAERLVEWLTNYLGGEDERQS